MIILDFRKYYVVIIKLIIIDLCKYFISEFFRGFRIKYIVFEFYIFKFVYKFISQEARIELFILDFFGNSVYRF